MKIYKILFSVGKDQPGIVDDISTILFEREANIEDSRMAVMGGVLLYDDTLFVPVRSTGNNQIGSARSS